MQGLHQTMLGGRGRVAADRLPPLRQPYATWRRDVRSWLRKATRAMAAELDAGFDSAAKDLERLTRMGGQRPVCALAGLVNTGKSSILNAMFDDVTKTRFAVADARCTTAVQREELGQWDMVDTPGLDAFRDDDGLALDTLLDSDALLFAHSVVDGEMDEPELACLRALARRFPLDQRQSRLLLILSKIDEERDRVEGGKVRQGIKTQWETIVGVAPRTFEISAHRYYAGRGKGKQGLVDASGVPALCTALAADGTWAASQRTEFWAGRVCVAVEPVVAAMKLAGARVDEVIHAARASAQEYSDKANTELNALMEQIDNAVR